ncbi:uncharacterized protein [Asterias amurensis]|uniref:uncharacterized protein n=1 Tax=Asterias amurensis TaxID=7602 RepID=UPI003AB4F9CE
MKSVSVKGSFHSQLSSTNIRQLSGRTKRPLLFKGKGGSRCESSSTGFSSLLNGVDRDDLGPVDPNWFEKAASNGGDSGKDLECKEPQVESLEGVASLKHFSDIGETPSRHRKASDEVDLGTPHPFYSPPSLFTPDERHHGVQRQCDGRQYFTRTSNHPIRNGISPETPSLVPITPNLPVAEGNTLRQTPSLLGDSPFSVEQSALQDPSPCWNSTHKQTTPTFMKQLFKTPSSLMKLDDFSFTTPGPCLSTPVRMSVSLGADLNDSNLSWTSSLATPQGATDTTSTKKSLFPNDWNEESTVVAKALFTSCIETPNCHTPSRGRIDNDSQASTVHLQSLHMSSADEDILGDTLESDHVDGEEAGKVKKVDGDAQGGRTGCGGEEEKGPSHSNCVSGLEEQESISTDIQSRTEDGKQDIKKTCEILIQATAEDDGDDAETVKICSSAIPTQQHNTDNLLENQTRVTSGQPFDKPKQSSHSVQTVQTCSQQSTADLLDSSSPNVSGLSGVEKSRLDDTLAFFFLTPPQTRSRIANLKKQKQMKEIEERIHQACLSEHRDSADEIQEARQLESFRCPDLPLESAVRESSQEMSEKEMRTTRSRKTVVRIQEEDGSLKEVIENMSETQVSQASCKSTNFDTEGNFFHVVSEEDARMTADDSVIVLRGDLILTENLNASPEVLSHSASINNLPNISAQPNVIPTSIKDHQLTDACKPATISIDVTNLTPLKQTRKLDTAPNIDSPDIFSQISPEFVNALCSMTDQVSETNNQLRKASPPFNPPEQIQMSQGNSVSCNAKPDTCILPSGSMKSSSIENIPQPPVPILTLDKQASVQDLKPKPNENDLSFKDKDSENCSNIKEKDLQSQLFKMQPRATTTRRFFYPAGSCNPGQTGGRKAMQWMSEAVLVKSDEDKQEISEPGPIADNEKATVEPTHRNNSRSYSSTPAQRNSGFVTFNNFINSKRAQAPSFMYPTKVTVLHDKHVQYKDKPIQHGQTKHQATDGSNVNGQSGSSNTTSQTTPLSRRGPHNSSYSRVRRRTDTHALPAPKRLKTTLENEHQGSSFRCSDGKGVLTKTEEISENEKAPCTKLCTSVVQTSNGGSISDESGFILKGATSTGDSDHRQLTNNVALSKDIQRQTGEDDMHFSSMTNKLAADEWDGSVHRRNLETDVSQTQNLTIPATVGFSSASGNAIHISESALHKARALFDEDSEKQRSAIGVTTNSLKLNPNNQKKKSESDNDVGSSKKPVDGGFTSASSKSIQISESALNKAKTLFAEEDPKDPISSSDSASTSRGAMPKTLGFSSASGKAIKISESALNKAKTLFAEEDPRDPISSSDTASTSRGAMPKTLGFSSASGKAIKISESALNKAKTLFAEEDPKDQISSSDSASTSKGAVPKTLGFSSASDKAIKISESALNKAKTLFAEEDPKDPNSSMPSISASKGAEPKILGFSSASGKAIQISESALQKARLFLDDEQESSAQLASRRGNNISQSESGMMKSTLLKKENDKELPITQNSVIREHDVHLEIAELNSSALAGDPLVPSKVGFASASGKPICVSETALQRAKQLFEKDGNEIPTTAGFASASGKSIEISDVDLKKARAMFEDSGDMPASSKTSCPETLTLPNELPIPHKQSRCGQGDSKPQTNYRNLPKGFRPFKAPAKMKTPSKSKTLLKQSHCLPTIYETTKDKTVPSLNLESIPETQEMEFTSKGFASVEMVRTPDIEFEEEFLTASQAQREIEAAEEMESAYAFMQAEEDSFSQYEDLSVGKFIPGMGPARPLLETAVMANQNVQNQESSKQPANQVSDDKEPFHELLSAVQGLSSQTYHSLNQAFVQSQLLSTGDVTEVQVTIPISFSQQEDSKREINKILPKSNISSSVGEMEIPWSNTPSSLNTEKPTFIGFKTAGGNKVEIAQDALRKAKAFLDADSKYEDSCVMKASQKANTNPADQTQDQKESFHNGSNFSGFQTAGGRRVEISKEALKKAKNLFSEEEIIHSRAPEGLGMINVLSKFPVGFQTASGSKVSVSEESLKRARHVLEGDDVGFRKEEKLSKIASTASDESRKQSASCDRKTNSQGSVLIDDKRCGGSLEIASSTPRACSGFQTASGNKVTVSAEALSRAHKFLRDDGAEMQRLLADTDDAKTKSQTRSSKTFTSHEENDVPEGAVNTFNKTPAPHVGFQTTGTNKVRKSAESLTHTRRVVVEGGDSHIAQKTSGISSHNKEDIHSGQSHSSQHVPPTSVGFQTASGKKVTISADSLTKAQRFLANIDGEPNTDQRTSPSKATASKKGESSLTGLVQTSNQSRKLFDGFQTASGDKVTISAESLANVQRFLADADGTLSHPKAIEPCLGFSTASGSKVSVRADALATAQRFLDDGNDTVPTPRTTQPCLGFSTASGSKVSVRADALATAQRFLANSNDTVTAPRTTQPCVGFSTANGNKVLVSDAALRKAQSLFQDDDRNTNQVFHHNTSSGKNQSTSDQASRPSIPLGFQTARGSSVSVSRTSLQQVKAFLGDDVSVSGMQSGGVSRQRSSHGEGTTSVALVPEYDSSTVDPTEAQTKSRPSFSRKNAEGLRMNDRHPGGDCNDAVVPHCGANTTSRLLKNAAKDKTLKGILQKGGLPSKPSTSATHPLPRSHLNSHQLTPKSTGPSNSSQVVPQTVPLASLQHSMREQSFSSNLSNREVVTNKRGYDAGSGDANSDGPTPKRAKVEVDMKGDSGRRNAVLSPIEQDVGLPIKEWEEARRNQASRIHSKKKQVIKPIPGELISKKQQGPRLPLYELVHGQAPELYPETELLSCGVLPSTLTVTSSTAEDFKFILKEHFTPDILNSDEGLTLGDGGSLVPDEAGTAGKKEFLNALLDAPGVDPKFLTSDWVNNHYRWIVWKLAAMEKAYPYYLTQRFLTPHQVLLQLKYRYDREIDHAQRSALKKILERDDTPSRRLVLCVAGIHRPGTGEIAKSHQGTTGKENEKMAVSSTPVLLLTDGWYAIKTLIDKPLAGLVNAGKIFEGLKLCIYGAELVGSQDACSPLEVPGNLMLRISANSTRRARYDALLGFQRYPQPFPISLTSLYPDGGMVGCVDVVVVRSYPMQYMEKQTEGGCVFRGRRAEDKEAARFAQEKQRQMERLYSKIQNDYQENEKKTVKSNRRLMSSRKLTRSEVEKLYSGQEVYEALNNALDPGAVEALLSERQVNVMHDYQRSLHEKKQSDLQGEFKRAMEEQKQESHVERSVTPLLRLRVVDALRRRSAEECGTHQLTIWRPSDDVTQLLTEGKRFKIFNVSTSSGRFSVGSNNVQLASTRGTRYQAIALATSHPVDEAPYLQRESLRLPDTLRPGFNPAYGEVDVVGVVVLIQGAGNSTGKSTSQTVYLCDAQANFIALRFWGGLQAHCVDNIIKPGYFLAVSNLQWRPNSGSSSIPCLHANDAVAVTTLPKANHLKLAMQDLQKTIKNPKAFAQSMEQSVQDRIAIQSRVPTPQTPRSGHIKLPSAMPCSAQGATPCSAQGNAPWAVHRVTPLADNGPNRCMITPHRTPVRGNSFGMDGGASHAQNTTPGFPSANQFPVGTGAHRGSLPRPHAASTPLHSINTTPMRGRPSTHPFPSPYGQTSHTDSLEKSRLNTSRKVDLLSRVPSPPPLSPLPTPPAYRVMSNFRAPSARTSVPQQGSSCRSRANSAFRGQGAKLFPRPQSWQAEDVQCEEVRRIDFDENATKPQWTGLDSSAIEAPGRPCSERSPEDMTASQQQVLEVLGMSYKSLGEIDWEWTQNTHSEPSQDFSYDTPSQSSPPAEEGLLDAKVLDTNRTKPKMEVEKLKKPSALEVPAVDENPQSSSKEKKVESASGRNQRGISRRGRCGRKRTYSPSNDQDSPKSSKVTTAEKENIVDGKGGCLKKASLDPTDTGVMENELTSSKKPDQKSVEDTENVSEGGDCVKLSEKEVSSSGNTSCKETREVTAKEKTLEKRSANSGRKRELESSRESQKCSEDSEQTPGGVNASGEHPLESAQSGRKRRERSRVDLSILEQSSLLGDESGEPTRRLTRSASQRTATKGGCKK